ncbi:MAG: protoporphyrinogen oxidase, partial [Acidobacteriota bacterium]
MSGAKSGAKAPGGASPHELVVVGGGISGLAVAHFARLEGGIDDVVVLEAAPRPGGKVQTEWIDGYCCEWGPQGFLDNVQDTLDLAGQLGLNDRLVRASDASSDRFIARGGRLRRVPLSPPAFLISDVLSLPGRLRVLLEPFQSRGPVEESVFDFAARRIGVEAASVLVDAMVTGVYAGDPRRLSLPATFPRMREMESLHGSLVRAMVAKARERRRAPAEGRDVTRAAGPAGPGGTLTTFRMGMQEITDALAASLAGRVRTAAEVEGIERTSSGFGIRLAGGDRVEARSVALAVPPAPAATMLRGLLPAPAIAALRSIPTVRVAVVMTGYRTPRPFREPTRGFGFLVPAVEGRRVLGTIFCDATFPDQAPPGHTLLRTLLGGARDGAVVDLSDADLVAAARRDLSDYLGGDPRPDFVRVIRHPYAIPQYTLGHLERLAAIDAALAGLPGLTLTGNGFRGIALNACVTEARALASRFARTPR